MTSSQVSRAGSMERIKNIITVTEVFSSLGMPVFNVVNTNLILLLEDRANPWG